MAFGLIKNKLSTFPFRSFMEHKNISLIYLNDNKIKSIDGLLELIRANPTIIIDLENNPIVCDCDVYNLVDWYHQNYKKPVPENDAKIVSTYEKVTIDVPQLYLNGLCSNPKMNIHEISILDITLIEKLSPLCAGQKDIGHSSSGVVGHSSSGSGHNSLGFKDMI